MSISEYSRLRFFAPFADYFAILCTIDLGRDSGDRSQDASAEKELKKKSTTYTLVGYANTKWERIAVE
jgi:hypothetical protein